MTHEHGHLRRYSVTFSKMLLLFHKPIRTCCSNVDWTTAKHAVARMFAIAADNVIVQVRKKGKAQITLEYRTLDNDMHLYRLCMGDVIMHRCTYGF